MRGTVTLVLRPTPEALGKDWPRSGWRRLVGLAAADGGRLPASTTEPPLTAGLRLSRRNKRLSVAPVIARGGAQNRQHWLQIRRELRKGRGTLWLSDPELRALDGFVLRDEQFSADEPAQGRWRRCLTMAEATKEIGTLLQPVDASDPFWQQLDALHRGSFYRYDSDAEIRHDEAIVAIDDVENEDAADGHIADDIVPAASTAGITFAGWWNPIVLQFSSAEVGAMASPDVKRLLGDPAALLDVQITFAKKKHAGAADGALAARYWLHEALRRRAREAGIASAPLPRLIFGPDARPDQALAFLLLDLPGSSFLMDVAPGRAKRPTVWLGPIEDGSGAVGTVEHWLRAFCCALLRVEVAAPGMTVPVPIEPVTLGLQTDADEQLIGSGESDVDHAFGLAALADDLDLPASLSELARALDYPHEQRESDKSSPPGAEVAFEAAAVLREALAPGAAQSGRHVALLEGVASALALPRAAILLRFPGPPEALGPAQRAVWQAQAERCCISLTESVRAAGYWWFAGLGRAQAAGTNEPPWNVHEVHWAAELYRAAFVQAAPSWRPTWYVATNEGLGKALLGEMILGDGGPVREPMLPERTRIANVNWDARSRGRT